MFGQTFSSEYFSATYQLEKYNGDKVVIDAGRFDETGNATEQVKPLMMKVGTTHFPVYPSTSVPYDIMAIPKIETEEIEESLPTEKSVLIPKRQRDTRRLF